MYKSNVFFKQTEHAGKLSTTDLHGRVRIAHGTYTPDGSEAAGSVIGLVRLPKGARVLPMSAVHFAAGQSASLKVKAGDADNPARYLAEVAPGSAAVTKELAANATAEYLLPAESDVIITTGDAALVKDKVIVFDILYVVD